MKLWVLLWKGCSVTCSRTITHFITLDGRMCKPAGYNLQGSGKTNQPFVGITFRGLFLFINGAVYLQNTCWSCWLWASSGGNCVHQTSYFMSQLATCNALERQRKFNHQQREAIGVRVSSPLLPAWTVYLHGINPLTLWSVSTHPRTLKSCPLPTDSPFTCWHLFLWDKLQA